MSFLCLHDKFSQVLQLKSLSYYLQDFVYKVSSGCDEVFCSCFIITRLLSRYCSCRVLPRGCEAECPSELILLRTVWFLVIVELMYPFLYWLSVRVTISYRRLTTFFAFYLPRFSLVFPV